jgi:hypothetical protein
MRSRRSAHSPTARVARSLVALLAMAALLVAATPAWGHADPPLRTTPTQNQPPCLPTATNCGTACSNALLCAPQSTTPSTAASAAQGDGARENDLPALDAGDPFCGPGLDAEQEQNCRVSGSVAEPYPLSSYELDYLDPPTGLSQLSPGDWFGTVLGVIVSTIWDVWLYVIRGVLDLLDWAFSLDLIDSAMSSVKNGLDTMHNDVFGSPWMLAALAILGLWGIWNGLVRRKTIETIGGLAVTVVLMIGALVLIAQPDQTVGQFSRYMNQASLAALNAGTRASVDVQDPAKGFASTESGTFTALVLRPWCALEFGDVSYCTEPRPGGMTIADIWLSFPAMGPGRQSLYNLATTGSITQYGGFWGSAAKDLGLVSTPQVTTIAQACGSGGDAGQCKALKAAQALTCWGQQHASASCALTNGQSGEVQMQSGGSALARIALLGMISLGLLGAVLVLLYLGIKLLFAAIKVLLLTLAAPVMLFVPAFGEAGRATFLSWGQRLVGALVSKLVYAVMLALVLLIASIINSLSLGWFSVWMLNIVFWWGIFMERRTFTEFLSMDKRAREGGLQLAGEGHKLGYAGTMLAAAGMRRITRVTRGTIALPRAIRERGLARRMADSVALREGDGAELEARTRRSLELAHRDRLAPADKQRLAAAEATIGTHKERLQSVSDLQAERNRRHGQLQQAARDPATRARAEAEIADLNDRIARAQAQVEAGKPGVLGARETVRALTPDVTPAHIERAVAQRRRDVTSAFPVDDTTEEFHRALLAANIQPQQYHAASPARQAKQRAWAQQIWERDKRLLEATDPTHSWRPYDRAEINRGWADLSHRGEEAIRRARGRSIEEHYRQRFESQHHRSRPRRPY